MAASMRFGALLIPNQPWATMVERCRRLEALGIEVAWVDDHIVNPGRPSQSWFEAWTMLAGLAASTTTIRLGTMVSNIVLRHPALLAREALTVEQISGGRLELGVGAGYAPTDHAAVAQPQWAPAERHARFGEALALLDGLLRGTAATLEGRYYPLEGAQFRPAPIQQPRPPLTVAAHHGASFAHAARYGEAWSSFGGYGLTSDQLFGLTRERNERLNEECGTIGRDPATLGRSLLCGNPAVTPDPIWSSVGAFEEFVGRYREIGITELVFYYPPETIYPSGNVAEGIFERVATDVLPSYR